MAKILKRKYSESMLNSTKLASKHPWVMGIQVLQVIQQGDCKILWCLEYGYN